MTTSDTQLNDTLNRITEKVEAIAGFVGRSAELQLATQHKLDHMSEMLDQMAEQSRSQDQKWEQRMNQMSETMQRQDEKWDRRLDLLTAPSERQQASVDRMAASIENAAMYHENVLAEYQKTAQNLIQLATMIMQQKAG